MYAEERQEAMARLVADRRRVSVTALAEQFDVTTETVRRDLSALERAGLLRRVHGGAVPAHALASIEAGLLERDALHPDAKERIARAALDLLPPDGSSVLLDAGSSTQRLAASWPAERRLTVFTHAVPVAARLASLSGVDLHLLPGRVRTTTQAAVGPDTIAALSRLRADLVVLGTNALSLERGLTTPDADEAATKRALVAAARRVVVLADSSKIGGDSTVCFAEPGEIDVVVTDTAIDPADRRALEQLGIEVLVA
jgi:DeoR family fructose operon transcriptional repressor